MRGFLKVSFHTAQKFSSDITSTFPAVSWHGAWLFIKISMMSFCIFAGILYQAPEYLKNYFSLFRRIRYELHSRLQTYAPWSTFELWSSICCAIKLRKNMFNVTPRKNEADVIISAQWNILLTNWMKRKEEGEMRAEEGRGVFFVRTYLDRRDTCSHYTYSRCNEEAPCINAVH